MPTKRLIEALFSQNRSAVLSALELLADRIEQAYVYGSHAHDDEWDGTMRAGNNDLRLEA